MRTAKLTETSCATVALSCATVALWLRYLFEIVAPRFCATVCATVRYGRDKPLKTLRQGCATVRYGDTPPKGGGFGPKPTPPFLWGSSWLVLKDDKTNAAPDLTTTLRDAIREAAR